MSLMLIRTSVLKLCQKLKIIPDDLVSLSQLEQAMPIEKQLDEYRELIEDIEKQTHFFSRGTTHWSKNHAFTLDEYLQTLCQRKIHRGRKIASCKIRPRPLVIEVATSDR